MNTNVRNHTRRSFVTVAEFDLWLAIADAGDILQYHDGFLALDTIDTRTRFSANTYQQLIEIANRARWASDESMVHLVQRRLGPNRFAYLAVKRKNSQRKAMHPRHFRPASSGS